jgi:hypothetical protein
MMIVISTQDRENYAAHAGFTGEYFWKMKGGSVYKITDVPLNIDYAEVVDMVRGEIEDLTNDYFQTEIIGWSVESDDYLSWFEKSQLEYDGEITCKEPEIEYGELNARYA